MNSHCSNSTKDIGIGRANEHWDKVIPAFGVKDSEREKVRWREGGREGGGKRERERG